MTSQKHIKQSVSTIADLLERIAELDAMIDIHQANEHKSMLNQYIVLRQGFFEELKILLLSMNLKVESL
jgi:hypothetical protein